MRNRRRRLDTATGPRGSRLRRLTGWLGLLQARSVSSRRCTGIDLPPFRTMLGQAGTTLLLRFDYCVSFQRNPIVLCRIAIELGRHRRRRPRRPAGDWVDLRWLMSMTVDNRYSSGCGLSSVCNRMKAVLELCSTSNGSCDGAVNLLVCTNELLQCCKS